MRILTFCFCKDAQGHFGLVRQFDHGQLLITFDDGDRWVSPNQLTFL